MGYLPMMGQATGFFLMVAENFGNIL